MGILNKMCNNLGYLSIIIDRHNQLVVICDKKLIDIKVLHKKLFGEITDPKK
jgi:hypothetical protein